MTFQAGGPSSGATDPGGLPDRQWIEGALEEVWRSSEFERREPSFLARMFGGLWEDFLAYLERLFSRLGPLEGLVMPVGQVVLVVLLAAGILGVGFLVYRWLDSLEPGRRGSGEGWPVGAARSSDPEWWEEMARVEMAAGRFRTAAVHLYRALVLRLGARGLLRVRDGRTPGDYLLELEGAAPDTGRAFRRFLGHFHPVAYGPQRPDAAAFRRLEELAAGAAREET